MGGKQQVEPAGGLQLGIEALQQLGLGGLIESPIRHGADQLETESQRRTDRQARLPERAGLGGAEPFDGGRGQQGQRAGAKLALLWLVDEGELVTGRDQQPARLIECQTLLLPPQLLVTLLHPDDGGGVDEHPVQRLLADPEIVVQLQQRRAHPAGS